MGGIGSAICAGWRRGAHHRCRLPAGLRAQEEWLGAMRKDGFKVHAAEGNVADYDSCAEMFYHVQSVVGMSTSWSTTPGSRAIPSSSA